MSEPVTYINDQGVALITIANPPVNALSQRVRAGLLAAVQQFGADDSAQVAVILGEGRLFIGGADISEFGKPPQAPSLPDVINAIESCDKPVVAAVHGAALGGGFEVALGAHYRIAGADARFGLPEVKLGLLPGAGGTQRLPRLVGVEQALTMITSGTPISAAQALEHAVVEQVFDDSNMRQQGLDFARKLQQQGAPVRRTGELPRPAGDAALLQEWRTRLERSARGEVAALVALDAVSAATRLDLVEGLAEERRLFLSLMDTPQRAGLIHAFFAERQVAKLPELAGLESMKIEHIGVVGGGTMGAGIATSALLSGLQVTLVERDQEAADKARNTITGYLAAAIKRGKLNEVQRETILNDRLATVPDYNALADADLIIEAVFESMEVKQSVFKTLDSVAKPGAILATNTSYLDINEIASITARPESVIGLHFFSPAHVMKLLEVVVAERTAPERVASAFILAKRLGKTAVRAGVCDGFIGNRLLSHYRTAADHMLLDGASPYQIDKALKAYGFAMGPYAVADLAGLDIGYATRQRKAADAHPRDRYPAWADELFHLGRLGQKTGKGYYLYPEGSRQGVEDPEVEALVAKARQQAGINPRTFTDEEIVSRYMAAMINEGARVLEEGIAQRPLDIDVVLLYGYGFPRWRGGPMHTADQRGLKAVLADIQRFAEEDDHFWQAAPLLEKLVEQDSNFASLNHP
ncbi:3-hydroxyacyl-CoA dehydrogenase NAD-binding domain-containing protein [Granulosicoccus antarcticus]|uniref:Fatty acid oxidation complex subunit alpha n=1 Tax=Granulosicoccus antarcticus IMCC3135 TaxID=1192854 RepID=A0A2Z2NZA9_9GAMM|nr:3-hydroxyacyl-CoA dehydrogenase NAD-binding domain-containing protein [Granulosicoccus antarcticus]ASJ73137.1 Fatty acid oxidation complex subunit alpha [Granulosicoccus antarcticus IMCC3135]